MGSQCDICRAELGNVKMDTPLYCISCIEGIERLNMSPKRYRKHRELEKALGKG